VAVRAATAFVNAASTGTLADAPSRNLMVESAQVVASATNALLAEIVAAAKALPGPANQQILGCAKIVAQASANVAATCAAVAPAIMSENSQQV